MKNITHSLAELEQEQGTLVATEFIFGYRFSINVTDKAITLSQDEEYNKKNFSNILDLDRLWNTVKEVYNIDEERFFFAPIREYSLNCVFYDSEKTKDKPFIYSSKGFLIVEVVPKDGILIHQSRIPEFCEQLRLPYAKPIFVGTKDMLKQDLRELRSTSSISTNKIGAGIVIKNEPIQVEGGRAKRFYIESDYSTIDLDNTESPSDMARELIRTVFIPGIKGRSEQDPQAIPNLIYELEEKTSIKPINKKRFAKIMIEYLYAERLVDVDNYIGRCISALGSNHHDKFKVFLLEQAVEYIEDTVLNMERYRLQKSYKKSKSTE